jgi:hypothetical protein
MGSPNGWNPARGPLSRKTVSGLTGVPEDVVARAPAHLGGLGYKLKKVRDYSGGSLISKIQQAETLQELEEYRNLVLELARRRELSRGTIRKMEKAGKLRFEELSSRLIQLPERRLLVPQGGLVVAPGPGRY